MKYVIQKKTDTPAYLQLYRQLRDDIINEIYPYGTKLPSKRLTADETCLSTITVEHAYSLLCDEGYTEAHERRGYFVVFRRDDRFAAAASQKAEFLQAVPAACQKTGGSQTIPAARQKTERAQTVPAPSHASTSSEFPFSVLTKTMRRVINDFGEAILERSPNSGCLPLREAIRQYLARNRGIIAGTEQIIIGSGAEYLYSLIVELIGREQIYAIEAPSYQKIEQVYCASNIHYEMLPLGHDGIESPALWASGASVLHITPYRSFPSGVTASASKRHEYLHWARQNHRYIVEDDYESEFSVSHKPEETLFSYTSADNVIYMNTFSQTISPSLRVGYMVLPAHLVPVFEQKLGFYSCTVPTYIQFVLAELITNGDFERHINRVRRKKRKEVFM